MFYGCTGCASLITLYVDHTRFAYRNRTFVFYCFIALIQGTDFAHVPEYITYLHGLVNLR